MTEDAVLRRAARYAQSGAEGLPALRRALDLLLREAPPRSCFRLLPCRAGERGARIGGCDIAGEALARALRGLRARRPLSAPRSARRRTGSSPAPRCRTWPGP